MEGCGLVEIWRSRPEWHALTRASKEQFLDKGKGVIQEVTDKGAKLLGVYQCRAFSDGGWAFFCDWQMPNLDLVIELAERLEQIGWNQYFEQINYVGKAITTDEYFNGLLRAEAK